MSEDAFDRVYCSRQAFEAAEPLYGTAEPVDVWVLVEYAATWKARALEANTLPPAVNAWLAGIPAAVKARTGLRARVQFIKQGRRVQGPEVTVIVALAREAEPVQFRFAVAGAAALPGLDVAAVAADPDAFAAQRHDEPVYLVCTNGQRDTCCARFGRPLFDRLVHDVQAQVWETTHVGGHRYAPNLVCLPQGIVYGFVDPEEADEVLELTREGLLSLGHLRGRSCFSGPVQAAEYHLLYSDEASEPGHYRLESHASGADGEQVVFIGEDGRRHRIVMGREAEQVLGSCGDAALKTVVRFPLRDHVIDG